MIDNSGELALGDDVTGVGRNESEATRRVEAGNGSGAKFYIPCTRHKTGHFENFLPNQSLGSVLKKLNSTRLTWRIQNKSDLN